MFWPGCAEVLGSFSPRDLGCGMAAGNDGANKKHQWQEVLAHLLLVFQLLSGHTEALPGLKCPFKLYDVVWEWRRMGISS